MKYEFQLTVNGEKMDLVSHDIFLELRSAGRASFVVQSESTLSGLVFFSFAINGNQHHGHFYGYIERSTAASSKAQTIFCREKSNLLEIAAPMALRNVTLADVIAEVENVTQCSFTLPTSGDYLNTSVAHFVNTGNGFHVLRNLEETFDIDDFTWLQKRDGSIYVGSWEDSHWANTPIDLPSTLLDKQLATQSAEILAIPGVRPGYVLNDNRLHSVRLQDAKMVVSWK